MQTYSLPVITALLPGALLPAQRRHTLTLHAPRYASLSPLRKHMWLRLNSWGIERAHIERLQLSVCEVVTNLIKHPTVKPDTVHVTISLHADSLTTDIADNGSPFATFDAKCNQAMAVPTAYDSMAECGYGLACIITQHRDISYRAAGSTPDALNHFILRDPIDVIAAPDGKTDSAINMTPESTTAAEHADKKTVFIVDDDTASLNIYAAILTRTYNVEVFTHAEDALQHFRAKKPSLIISDLAMAGMDGLTLRRHLSNLEGGDTVPFIFLGNTAAIAHERYVTQAGIDDYLCKPISPERLLAVSDRLIERAASFTAALHGKMNTRITELLNPQLPHRHIEWHIATRSAAAATGGGDFTLCRSNKTSLIAVLADVMGHGQDAKFFAYAYAGYLRSLMNSYGGDTDPAHFLARVSLAVNADSFLDSTIMTCISFLLQTGGQVTLASAGHPPPWLVDGERHAHALDIAGPLPGLIGESRYVQKSIALPQGQRLVLGTDGFWDSWDNAQNLSFDLRTNYSLSLENYTDALWHRALERAQTRTRKKDDATLIVIENGGTP